MAKIILNLKAKKSFRNFLVKYTRCAIQEGEDGMSYPCGTCVINLFKTLGLDSRKKDYYDERNKPVDRGNEVWRAILQIRDAK